MIFKKYFMVILLISTILSAQTAPDFFKDTPVRHGLSGCFTNPAAMQSDQSSGALYSYNLENSQGELRHPFSPASFQYHTFTAAGFKKMKNQTLFSGSFSYRQNFDGNRLYMQNSSLNGMIPVYMADSCSGDWHLNGIQWTVDIMRPLTHKVSGGISVFYMVDEQYKQIFPKPGVKRSGYLVNSGLFYATPALRLSGTLGLFEFKEEMSTVKYSLEQHLNPVFMLFRGYEDPIVYRGMTSYERLQTRQGLSLTVGASFNLFPDSPFYMETMGEWSRGEAIDGGTNNIPQGNWLTRRVHSRFSWVMGETNLLSPLFQLDNHYVENEAEHPDFTVTLFRSNENVLNGFTGLSLQLSEKNSIAAGLAAELVQAWREDAFHGIGLKDNSMMLGPSLSFSLIPPVPFEADIYFKFLTETHGSSQIKISPYRDDISISQITRDEFWAMTAGNTYIESGAEIRLTKIRQTCLTMTVSYRWLAEKNNNGKINADRDLLSLSLTIIPYRK